MFIIITGRRILSRLSVTRSVIIGNIQNPILLLYVARVSDISNRVGSRYRHPSTSHWRWHGLSGWRGSGTFVGRYIGRPMHQLVVVSALALSVPPRPSCYGNATPAVHTLRPFWTRDPYNTQLPHRSLHVNWADAYVHAIRHSCHTVFRSTPSRLDVRDTTRTEHTFYSRHPHARGFRAYFRIPDRRRKGNCLQYDYTRLYTHNTLSKF